MTWHLTPSLRPYMRHTSMKRGNVVDDNLCCQQCKYVCAWHLSSSWQADKKLVHSQLGDHMRFSPSLNALLMALACSGSGLGWWLLSVCCAYCVNGVGVLPERQGDLFDTTGPVLFRSCRPVTARVGCTKITGSLS